jgi:hypothetical protein
MKGISVKNPTAEQSFFDHSAQDTYDKLLQKLKDTNRLE